MAVSKGHESRHLPPSLGAAPPLAWSWADVVDYLVAERGSLAELSRHLQDVAPDSAGLPIDTLTVERGLRRLRSRGNREGNKYGKWLLRCLGLPGTMEAWAQEIGQYHSRSSDLPVHQRIEQLRLWDCPPLTESRAAIWVHLGLASVAHRQQDMPQVHQRTRLVHLMLKRAKPIARLEAMLLAARLASDGGDSKQAHAELDTAEQELRCMDDEDPEQRACYAARIYDQRAYLLARGWRDAPEHLKRAMACYDAIPEQGPPFALFRREHGRAWCLWRLGDSEGALQAARLASTHAGDGGLVRFRIMSLGLQANILGPGEDGDAVLQRARSMAQRLGDAGLLRRLPEGQEST